MGTHPAGNKKMFEKTDEELIAKALHSIKQTLLNLLN
jgi:hypothetical protein